MIVELLCFDQVLELSKSREPSEIEDLARHVDPFEQFAELPCTRGGISSALKSWKAGADFVKRNAVAPGISRIRTQGYVASGEHAGDDLGNLLYLVIFSVLSNVEDLIMDGISRGL